MKLIMYATTWEPKLLQIEQEIGDEDKNKWVNPVLRKCVC